MTNHLAGVIQSCTASTAILCFAATITQASAASSSAYGISAQFTSGGKKTGLSPLDPASGSTPPNYSKSATLGSVQQIVRITESSVTPALVVNAASLRSSVAGGFGIDTISANGNATIKSLNLSLMLYPPPPTTTLPEPQPFLEISATKVQSNANYSNQVPITPTVSAGAILSGMTISGSLVDNKILKFSGSPAANTVLFNSPTLTITLNQQMPAGVISCSPNCTFTPVAIKEQAIDIVLNHANLFGRIVSGEIGIGVDQAGAGLTDAQSSIGN